MCPPVLHIVRLPKLPFDAACLVFFSPCLCCSPGDVGRVVKLRWEQARCTPFFDQYGRGMTGRKCLCIMQVERERMSVRRFCRIFRDGIEFWCGALGIHLRATAVGSCPVLVVVYRQARAQRALAFVCSTVSSG